MKLRMCYSRCHRCYRYYSCLRCCYRYSSLMISMCRSIIGQRLLNRCLDSNRCYRCLVISLLGSIILVNWINGIGNCGNNRGFFGSNNFHIIRFRCSSRCNISFCYNRCNCFRHNRCNCFRHWSFWEISGCHFETFSIRNIVDCLKNSIGINIAISSLNNAIRSPEFLF